MDTSVLRVGVVQMHYRIAGFGGSIGNDYLREVMPYPFISQAVLRSKRESAESRSAQGEELPVDMLQYFHEHPDCSDTLSASLSYIREGIQHDYQEWLRVRLKRIVEFAREDGIEILVFPEYSIPAECLEDLATHAKELLAVIAGSHFATSDCARVYEKLGLGTHEGKKLHFQTELCPVFRRNLPPDFVSKNIPSEFEPPTMRPGTGPRCILVRRGADDLLLGVALCNEFLPTANGKDALIEEMKECCLFIVASCSEDYASFWKRARYFLKPHFGVPTLFANDAEYGNSTIFTKSDIRRDVSSWESRILRGDHILPLEQGEEGIVAANIVVPRQVVRTEGVAHPTSMDRVTTRPRRIPFLYDRLLVGGETVGSCTFEHALGELDNTEWDFGTFRQYFRSVSTSLPSPLKSGIMSLNNLKNYRGLDLHAKRKRLECVLFPIPPSRLGDLSLPELTYYQLADLYFKLRDAMDDYRLNDAERVLVARLAKKTREWQEWIVSEFHPSYQRNVVNETWDIGTIRTSNDIERELKSVFESADVLEEEITRRCNDDSSLTRKAALMCIYVEKCQPRSIPNVLDWA